MTSKLLVIALALSLAMNVNQWFSIRHLRREIHRAAWDIRRILGITREPSQPS